jgi:hypothetical protein
MSEVPMPEPVALLPEELCTVSPSQLVTFDAERGGCQRKWAFQKLLGLRHETAATILGGDVHAVRELYLGTGEPIDQTTKAGQIAATGLAQIPAPGTVATEVEFHFALRPWAPGYGGLSWHGIIDMISMPGFPSFDSIFDSIVFIGDHKTTKNLRYAKSETELRSDPQWNTYVEYGFSLVRPAYPEDLIKTLWHYLTTVKPYVPKPVVVWAERGDPYRLEQVEYLKSLSYDVETIRRKPPKDVNELPPNFNACRDYGGCPFQGHQCRSSVSELFQFKPEGTTMAMSPEMQAKLAAMKNGGAAPAAAAAAPINPPADSATPAARRPGRPPGSTNKPKEPETDGNNSVSIDLSEVVGVLKSIATEQARHHAAMESAAETANEIAMNALEVAMSK